jgi:membrane-associated HD superfamily phosphohydrolase
MSLQRIKINKKSKKQKNMVNNELQEISESETNEITQEEVQVLQDIELKKRINNFDAYLKQIYYLINRIFNFIYKVIKYTLKITGIYLLWICLHYVSSHLYIKFCVPNNLYGFLISPFMTATPHCQGLRWIIYNAANVINNMWVILGTWLCSTILIVRGSNMETNL